MIVKERRSLRLPDFDYAGDGAYFVTLCTYQRVCLFGEIVNGEMQLSELGEIVREEWLRTAIIRPYVALDEFVIMPNHVHAVLFIMKADDDPAKLVGGASVGAQRAALLRPHVASGSLGAIVRGFKSAVTKRVNEQRGQSCARLWQRDYDEHVIRNESLVNDIRSYIQTNPARWAEDSENPANQSANNRVGAYGDAPLQNRSK